MYSPPQNINGTKGFGEILLYVNNVTGSVFSNMMLITIWIIILIGYYKARDDFGGAMGVAGFVTFVIGLLFWLGGFVSGVTLSIVIGMAIIGIIATIVERQ